MKYDLRNYYAMTPRSVIAMAVRCGARKVWLNRSGWENVYVEAQGMLGVTLEEYEPGKLALRLPMSGTIATLMCDPSLEEHTLETDNAVGWGE